MQNVAVYAEADRFKSGWIAGFYDARTDDGLRYLDDILRYGVRNDDDRARFLAGYRAGQMARNGHAAVESSAEPGRAA